MTPEQVKTLVAQIPDADKNGTYVNLDEAMIRQIEKVTAELAGGGADAAAAVIDLLVEPGKGDDRKAHYALHLLALRHSGGQDDKARAAFSLVLAGQLAGQRPAGVKQYLLQELQVCGGAEAVPAVGACLLEDDLCDWAGRTLASIRQGAAEQFLAALPKAKGKARLVAVSKLAFLRDPKAGAALKAALADNDADTRVAAGWGLVWLKDAASAGLLLKAADAAAGYERNQLTDACLSLAQTLAGEGKKDPAAAIYDHLSKTRTDPSEKHFRQAAQQGLKGLNAEPKPT